MLPLKGSIWSQVQPTELSLHWDYRYGLMAHLIKSATPKTPFQTFEASTGTPQTPWNA